MDLDRWTAIVGDEAAGHTRAVALHDQVLHVVADSLAGALRLRELRPALLEKIGTATGEGVVNAIEVAGPGRCRQRRDRQR